MGSCGSNPGAGAQGRHQAGQTPSPKTGLMLALGLRQHTCQLCISAIFKSF